MNSNTIKIYKSNKKGGIKHIFLLFFILPFLAFSKAIGNYNLRESKIIVYLFFVYFGFTMVLGNELMDSYRVAEDFKQFANIPNSEFWNVMSGFYQDEFSLDIVQSLLFFALSRISDSHNLLFGVYAAIFSFFYIKSINLIYPNYASNKSINALFFFFFFIILNPISNINGFRFYSAVWVFFWGAYMVIVKKEKKFLIIALSSTLFHFSFISASSLLLLYVFIGNRNLLFYILFILSFLATEFSPQISNELAEKLGSGFADKTSRYANESTIEYYTNFSIIARAEGKWYLYLPDIFIRFFMIFAFFYTRFRFWKFIKEKSILDLYSFILLFLAFANFFAYVPSMWRFMTVFYIFTSAFIINTLKNDNTKSINMLTIVGVIPAVFLTIVTLRTALDILNPWLFTFFPLPFMADDVSVYQLLFQ